MRREQSAKMAEKLEVTFETPELAKMTPEQLAAHVYIAIEYITTFLSEHLLDQIKGVVCGRKRSQYRDELVLLRDQDLQLPELLILEHPNPDQEQDLEELDALIQELDQLIERDTEELILCKAAQADIANRCMQRVKIAAGRTEPPRFGARQNINLKVYPPEFICEHHEELTSRALLGSYEARNTLYDFADALTAAGKPLPLWLQEFLIWAARNARGSAGRKRGRDPYANEHRNSIISNAVGMLAELDGFRPSRNTVTKAPKRAECGCSIVANALARVGIHMTEANVTAIWQAERFRAERR